jgi:Protein of unknown function (DUF4058)
MSSPFPGMDPFVESQGFRSLHSGMIFLMQQAMQPQLPVGYYAGTNERVWIDTARWIEPDVKISRERNKPLRHETGGAVVATLAKPVIITIPQDERTEPYLNIYKKIGDKKRLVCSIEILSFTNKTPGEKGQKLYHRKQRRLLNRKVHLVEIDLLRAGQHSTAVMLEWAKFKAGDFDYHVCVRRFNQFEKYDVYPILMQERLPIIAVPLLPADGDIEGDLQAIFQKAYDAGPFQRAIDYRKDKLDPPLMKEQETWMRSLLRKAGITRAASK